MKESLFDRKRRFGGVGIHQSIMIADKYRNIKGFWMQTYGMAIVSHATSKLEKGIARVSSS